MSTFVGHLHPVIVHLPIGFLLIAILFYFLTARKILIVPAPLITIVIALSFASALTACITGYLLSGEGGYNESMLQRHMWSGFALSFITLTWLVLRAFGVRWFALELIVAMLVFGLVVVTGHLGGSLTHGEGYLTSGLNDTLASPVIKRIQISDLPRAMVYNDIVQPLIDQKCTGCHGSRKQKGGLRMDDYEKLMKGGKNGAAIVPFAAAQTEMLKRIHLGLEDEHHMPPKGKPQITEQEYTVLTWWVQSGAPGDKHVQDLPKNDALMTALNTVVAVPHVIASIVPDSVVTPPDTASINKLREEGVLVQPLAYGSRYLSANFVNDSVVSNGALSTLAGLRLQLLTLDLSRTRLQDDQIKTISNLTKLRSLNLSHTQITDVSLPLLSHLTQLETINLVGTRITANGVKALAALPKLKRLYLYQTLIPAAERTSIQSTLKRVVVDTGNYGLEFIPSDTVVLKANRKY